VSLVNLPLLAEKLARLAATRSSSRTTPWHCRGLRTRAHLEVESSHVRLKGIAEDLCVHRVRGNASESPARLD
jgi:hypothetical protein